jgi:hypothetical protein
LWTDHTLTSTAHCALDLDVQDTEPNDTRTTDTFGFNIMHIALKATVPRCASNALRAYSASHSTVDLIATLIKSKTRLSVRDFHSFIHSWQGSACGMTDPVATFVDGFKVKVEALEQSYGAPGIAEVDQALAFRALGLRRRLSGVDYAAKVS